MQTRTRFMRTIASIFVGLAAMSCSSNVKSTHGSTKPVARLCLERDAILTLTVYNPSMEWLVFESFVDVDANGKMNTERLVLRSGRYIGKSAGPSSSSVVLGPGRSYSRSVDLTANYVALREGEVLPAGPLRLSYSVFFNERKAVRFAARFDDLIVDRDPMGAEKWPSYDDSVQVYVKIRH